MLEPATPNAITDRVQLPTSCLLDMSRVRDHQWCWTQVDKSRRNVPKLSTWAVDQVTRPRDETSWILPTELGNAPRNHLPISTWRYPAKPGPVNGLNHGPLGFPCSDEESQNIIRFLRITESPASRPTLPPSPPNPSPRQSSRPLLLLRPKPSTDLAAQAAGQRPRTSSASPLRGHGLDPGAPHDAPSIWASTSVDGGIVGMRATKISRIPCDLVPPGPRPRQSRQPPATSSSMIPTPR